MTSKMHPLFATRGRRRRLSSRWSRARPAVLGPAWCSRLHVKRRRLVSAGSRIRAPCSRVARGGFRQRAAVQTSRASSCNITVGRSKWRAVRPLLPWWPKSKASCRCPTSHCSAHRGGGGGLGGGGGGGGGVGQWAFGPRASLSKSCAGLRAAPRPRISAPAPCQTVRLRSLPMSETVFSSINPCQAAQWISGPRSSLPKGSIDAEMRAPGDSCASVQRPPALSIGTLARSGETALPPASRCALFPAAGERPCSYRQNSTQSTCHSRPRPHSDVAPALRSESIRFLNPPSMLIYWQATTARNIQSRLTFNSNRCAARIDDIPLLERTAAESSRSALGAKREDKRRRISPTEHQAL